MAKCLCKRNRSIFHAPAAQTEWKYPDFKEIFTGGMKTHKLFMNFDGVGGWRCPYTFNWGPWITMRGPHLHVRRWKSSAKSCGMYKEHTCCSTRPPIRYRLYSYPQSSFLKNYLFVCSLVELITEAPMRNDGQRRWRRGEYTAMACVLGTVVGCL